MTVVLYVVFGRAFAVLALTNCPFDALLNTVCFVLLAIILLSFPPTERDDPAVAARLR